MDDDLEALESQLAEVQEAVGSLQRRVRAVRESIDVEDSVFVRGDLSVGIFSRRVRWKGREVTLTRTQFDIVMLLAARPDILKNRNEILDYLERYDALDRTIDNMIRHIRKRFRAVDPDFAQIKMIYRIGYRWNAD